jgi:hypothetical protein
VINPTREILSQWRTAVFIYDRAHDITSAVKSMSPNQIRINQSENAAANHHRTHDTSLPSVHLVSGRNVHKAPVAEIKAHCSSSSGRILKAKLVMSVALVVPDGECVSQFEAWSHFDDNEMKVDQLFAVKVDIFKL